MLRGWAAQASSLNREASSSTRLLTITATTTTTAAASTAPSLFQQHTDHETPEPIRLVLLEALQKTKSDPGHRLLKALLKRHYSGKRFPTQFRLEIWSALLDHAPQPGSDAELSLAIRECEKNLENQRVIKVDVERTRADLPDFRKPETQEFASQLLTYFCKSRNARYKQGLNEMLAPFVYLYLQAKSNHPDRSWTNAEALVYRLFTTFIDRYLPHLYADDALPGVGGGTGRNEMIALQCNFRFFDLLLQYHDPELWQLLDHHKLKPELYTSSWFMTMFAQNMPIALLYELWEQLLLGDSSLSGDFLLIPFLSVAYLCTNRTAFLHADPSDLPVLLTSKLSYHRRRQPSQQQLGADQSSSSIGSDNNNMVLLADVLRPCIATANELRKHTPDVLLWEMRNILQMVNKPPVIDDLLRLGTRFCATCSPEFFWMGLMGMLEDSTEIIVIDCRPAREFARERARARLVFNMDEELLQHPDAVGAKLHEIRACVMGGGGSGDTRTPSPPHSPAGGEPESLSRAWRWHVCVVGVSGPSVNNPQLEFDHITGMAILHLLKHVLPCVCVVEGGWEHLVSRCPQRDRLVVNLTAPSSSPQPVTPDKDKSILLPSSRSNAKALLPHTPAAAAAADMVTPRKHKKDDKDDDDVDTGRSSVIVSRKSRGLPLSSTTSGDAPTVRTINL